jgi:hypothetical protein
MIHMNKYIIVITIFAIGIIGILLFDNYSNKGGKASEDHSAMKIELPEVERVEVFLFHGTRRCISCINIGKYAKKTVEENFAEEIKSGRIIFKEINMDLPENRGLAEKFQASGSSLFINTVRGGKDYIEQDSMVWRLVEDEVAFEAYLKDKIGRIMNNGQ